MKDNSLAVFFSGKAPRETADQYYEFSVDRNFYYLTGIDRENMVLLISKVFGKMTETLYIPEIDENFEKWYGILMRREQASEVSGIKNIENSSEFVNELFKNINNYRPDNIYVFSYLTDADEPYDSYRQLARLLRNQYPTINIINSLDILVELRSSKSEEEVDEIRKAIGYTREALEFVMKNLKPGMYE